jgi:SAM-dependent methyltransferase
VFDAFDALDAPSVLHATLVDLDPEALAFVAERRDQRRLSGQMSLVQQNLIPLVSGRSTFQMPQQDLIYSIGLIDYLRDALVVRLLNFAHAHLAPGGRVIVGNFHPRNPSKAFMDHVLDWKLIHRTENEMNALFSASSFGRPCTRIQFEDQGVNLFAECRRD